MDSNYRPGLNWPVTSSGTGFSESSKACACFPFSLSPSAAPIPVLSPFFFPQTLSKFHSSHPNFPSKIDADHLLSSFLFFFHFTFTPSNCWGRFDYSDDLVEMIRWLGRRFILFIFFQKIEGYQAYILPSLPRCRTEGLMSGIKPTSSPSRLPASENLIVK